MQTNQAGLDLIKSFEGCKLTAYRDVVGILTIGYGHTGPDVKDGLTWTQQQADDALAHDLQKFETAVSECVTTSISANQFSALVCFAYNCGAGNLRSSTLLKDVNAGNVSDAAAQFGRWNKAGGNVVAGLTRRRQAESDLFSKSDSDVQSSGDVLPNGPTDSDINNALAGVEK